MMPGSAKEQSSAPVVEDTPRGDADEAAVLVASLYERINNGESEALEQLFVTYEAQLRQVVRRQLPQKLRSKFDSTDVIQTVWASLLQGLRDESWHFPDDAHLRAFLVRLATLRFVDHCRHHSNALGRERPLTSLEGATPLRAPCDQPAEIAQANELFDRLMAICPPDHRELVRLRAAGHPLAEIAQKTGYHEGSIRRIFYDLARRIEAPKAAARPATTAPGTA